MSGLFATLAVAALGGEESLQPRPRAAFEPDGDAPGGLDAGQPLTADETQDAADPAQAARRGRAQLSGGDDLLLARDNANGPGPAAATQPLSRPVGYALGGRSEDSERLPDDDRAAPRQPAAASGQAVLAAPPPSSGQDRWTRQPGRPGDNRAEQPHGPAPRRDDGDDAPLLPLAARARDDPASILQPLAPAPREATGPRSAERRSLTIGRIEVRPPPPAPTPAPQQSTFRTQTIARALPRQSLDDYRRRGR